MTDLAHNLIEHAGRGPRNLLLGDSQYSIPSEGHLGPEPHAAEPPQAERQTYLDVGRVAPGKLGVNHNLARDCLLKLGGLRRHSLPVDNSLMDSELLEADEASPRSYSKLESEHRLGHRSGALGFLAGSGPGAYSAETLVALRTPTFCVYSCWWLLKCLVMVTAEIVCPPDHARRFPRREDVHPAVT